VKAAVLGLTDPRFNGTKDIQNIPNMDGFPNGRRLEDDVTRIELQAVSGVVLAAIGLWYDDYNGTGSPVTQDLVDVLSYTTGVAANDLPMQSMFPYMPAPHSGTGDCSGEVVTGTSATTTINRNIHEGNEKLNMQAPEIMMKTAPNPFTNSNTIQYHVAAPSKLTIGLYDVHGKLVRVLVDKQHDAGTYTLQWNGAGLARGSYYISAIKKDGIKQTISIIKQ
jgi:hypothetical protein